MIELVISDAAAMEALGARLAPLLQAGDLVQLDGELGAGKTTLTRGLGAALGAREAITSPTFVLAREHPTTSGTPLVHVDAYRLAGAVDVEDLDLDWEQAIVVVEWGAGKLDDAGDRIEVAIERPIGGDPLADDSPRHVRVTGIGTRWADLDAALAAPPTATRAP
ncbi:tRNA (adenosine(37)-N6)-threonylcarbamoyltransferase complex ATPase subunit type 1 TsaE [soil metagenome]